jgi:predicted site-specific integrase-resolvase
MLNISNHPKTPADLDPSGQTRIKPAAALLGVHHQTLRRYWKADKIAAPVNIQGILLFKNSDLLAFIDSQHANSDEV